MNVDRTPDCVKAALGCPGIYKWENSGISMLMEVDDQGRVHQLNPRTMERNGILSKSGRLCSPTSGAFTKIGVRRKM